MFLGTFTLMGVTLYLHLLVIRLAVTAWVESQQRKSHINGSKKDIEVACHLFRGETMKGNRIILECMVFTFARDASFIIRHDAWTYHRNLMPENAGRGESLVRNDCDEMLEELVRSYLLYTPKIRFVMCLDRSRKYALCIMQVLLLFTIDVEEKEQLKR